MKDSGGTNRFNDRTKSNPNRNAAELALNKTSVYSNNLIFGASSTIYIGSINGGTSTTLRSDRKLLKLNT